MYSTFEEVNLYVYNSIRGMFFDVVIWCLGPVVDETRPYGYLRHYLAVATVKVCQSWLRRRG